jgi:hypothetical protein
MENKAIDREMKIMLLQALKRGYFTASDLDMLSRKAGYEPITVEVIDRREQVRKADNQ